jgi:hypothetical protein
MAATSKLALVGPEWGKEFCFRQKKDRARSAELVALTSTFGGGVAEVFDAKENIWSLTMRQLAEFLDPARRLSLRPQAEAIVRLVLLTTSRQRRVSA